MDRHEPLDRHQRYRYFNERERQITRELLRKSACWIFAVGALVLAIAAIGIYVLILRGTNTFFMWLATICLALNSAILTCSFLLSLNKIRRKATGQAEQEEYEWLDHRYDLSQLAPKDQP